MSSRRRSQSSFWQHPAVIVMSVLLVAVLAVGAYSMTKPKTVGNIEALNAASQSSVSVALASITSSTTSAVAAVPLVVAFVGDSYTAGARVAPAQRFSTVLAARKGWTEKNFGSGGTGYLRVPDDAKDACGLAACPPYSEVIAKVAAAKPDIVVVSGGRNDVKLPEAKVDAAVRAFYGALRAKLPGARIVAVSPIWDSSTPPAQLGQIGAAVKASAGAVGGSYIDIGEPLAGRPAMISSDHLHPNVQGYAAIADAIAAQL